ncbi:TIGR03905 family TSCPD domain-containing protein [Papillibacter cinnamivorans]|uniref:ribonucleoside-diphosphate reductase n=1 Tax=Papillibacter cinnamivorans DSM 12816 TaxID=1122930 RepID=A0A1W2AAP0_9FIRM|nr:TIGR03905 family TSCPD domain-containing protein [Papillibacter cinnamivorans]SMC57785.1 uncharacterized protein TIGR03905 [Papillibacter cinnamivorans DSM 12816]
MTFHYKPKGVCSREMILDVEDGIIRGVTIQGGCPGNLQGISRLVEGMEVENAVSKLQGIRCGRKSTSCPDQLAKALKEHCMESPRKGIL